MKYWFLALIIIFVAGCASNDVIQPEAQTENMQAEPPPPTQETNASKPTVNLPDLGEAPELTNDVWLNVDQPLRLADLRGQVVLLDMWTFG